MFGVDDAVGMGVGAIGSGIGSYLNYSAQEDAIRANIDEARKNRDFQQASAMEAMIFSSQEAEKNRKFQERMSSTAYQRATRDMGLAGINPMVAFMQGGASTPSGATGQSSSASGSQARVDPARPGDIISSSLQSALQVGQFKKSMETQDSEIKLNQAKEIGATAQAAESVANAKNIDTDTKINKIKTPSISKKSDMEGAKADIDKSWLNWDAWLDRIGQLIGTAGSAKNVISGPPGGSPRPLNQRERDAIVRQEMRKFESRTKSGDY